MDKYGFYNGAHVFVDGGIAHKDQVGIVEYQKDNPGFWFRDPVTKELVNLPDDCMHAVEPFMPAGIDA